MSPVLSPSLKLDLLEETRITKEEQAALASFVNGLITDDLSEKKEYKKSGTGLARTVVFISKDEIYILLNRSKEGDPVLGCGTEKTFKLALNALTGHFVATCCLELNAKFEHEMAIRRDVETVPHTQKAALSGLGYEAEGRDPPKIRLFEPLSIGDLEKITATDGGGRITSGYPLSFEEKVDIANQLLEALQGFHAKGYFHRDIKPANILLYKTDKGFEATLCDFGVSAKKEDRERLLFRVGTDRFHSPEYRDYFERPLEMPEAYKRLQQLRIQLIIQINAVLDPSYKETHPDKVKCRLVKLSGWASANKTREDFAEAKADLDTKIGEMRSLEEVLGRMKPTKDFSCVTSEKHDIYAMGLILYSLFTSSSQLEILLTERSKEDADWTKLDFEGFEVPDSIQTLISGMLQKDPSTRIFPSKI